MCVHYSGQVGVGGHLTGLAVLLHYAWYRDQTQVVKFGSREALLPGINIVF